jgi:hypothetical protein
LSFLTATKLPSYPRTELVKFEKWKKMMNLEPLSCSMI